MSLNGYPQELIERIIDFVKGDEQKVSYPPADVLVIHVGTGRPHICASNDLRSCSLVSKAWLPRSRYHLFYHIALYGRYGPPRFIKLLGSPHGTIVPYVRRLQLYDSGYSHNYEVCWLYKALPRLALLPAIESLHIGSREFERLDDTVIASCFSNLRLLKSLRIDNCSFASFCQLGNALAASARLECLVVNSVRVLRRKPSDGPGIAKAAMFVRLKGFMRTPAYYITHRRSPPHLRILEIAKCGFIKKLSRWLQAGNEPVETLRLDIERRGDIPAYSALMRAVAWSLNELRIHFKNNVDLVDFTVADIFGHDADMPLRQRTARLPPITSPYLERISLDLGISSPEDLSGGIDWHAIDQVFSRPNFSSLKLVTVKVRVEMSPMDWRERRERTQNWLAARLPRCRARGIFDSEAISA